MIYLCLAHMSDEGYEQKFVKEAFDTNWVVQMGPNVNAFEEDSRHFVTKITNEELKVKNELGGEDELSTLNSKLSTQNKMSINELQEEVIAEFSDFTDWMDKYQLLIDLGNEQEPLDEKYKTESNLIDGCQSRVWLQADYRDGLLWFTAESDALIVKGIIALLIRVLSGHTPQEILDADLYFIERIGLREHLSPTRSNGLLAMVKQMRLYAVAYSKR